MSNKEKLLSQTPQTTQHRNITSQSRNPHYATSPSGLRRAVQCSSLSLIISDLTVATKKCLMGLEVFRNKKRKRGKNRKVGDKIKCHVPYLIFSCSLRLYSYHLSSRLSVCLSFSPSFCLSWGQPVDGKLISTSSSPCGRTFCTHLLCLCVCAAMFRWPEEENFQSGGLCPLVQQTLLPSGYRNLHGG